jgi:hypothetical protein
VSYISGTPKEKKNPKQTPLNQDSVGNNKTKEEE